MSENVQNLVYVGIRREDWSKWERRVPIVPQHIKELQQEFPDLRFIIQPCSKRSYPDSAYRDVGAILSDDLSKCSLIMSIKRPKDENTLLENKTYLFFGHFHKAQSPNIPLLRKLLEKKIRFLDIEFIKDERGRRQLYFGKYGGIAGTIDFLSSFGHFILKKGQSTPFLSIAPAYRYFKMRDAYEYLETVGQQILQKKLPKDLCPMVFAILGDGKVANGTWKVLNCLPIQKIDPNQLANLYKDKNNPIHRDKIYVCTIKEEHLVQEKDESERDKDFNGEKYRQHPDLYEPIFHEKYLPYISVIFNNIYWEPRYPRVITKDQIRDLVQSGRSRLLGVCDVACDKEGSIQFLRELTNPDRPCYVYDPISENISWDFNYKPNHIIFTADESYASHLGKDSSDHCSGILKNFVYQIAVSRIDLPLNKQGLPLVVRNSCATLNGELTEKFKRVENIIKQLESQKQTQVNQGMPGINVFMALKLSGHLFDKKVINKLFSEILRLGLVSSIADMYIGSSADLPSSIIIQVFAKDMDRIQKFKEFAEKICKENEVKLEDLLESREIGKVNSQFRFKL